MTPTTILILLSCLLISFIVVLLNKTRTSPRVIAIVYAYVVLSFCIIGFCMIKMKNSQPTTGNFWVCFILSLFLIFGIQFSSNILLRNILWVVFILCMGYIIYPLYQDMNQRNALISVMTTTFVIALVISIYGFYANQNLTVGWDKYLIISLLAVIVFELIGMFMGWNIYGINGSNNKTRLYAIIIIILFSCMLLSDTQRLIRISKMNGDINYPSESMNIFLSLVNLATGVDNLKR